MSDHTPTPWAHRNGILHQSVDKWKCLPINSPFIEDAFDVGHAGHELAVANAAFIVEAVNNHDVLVAQVAKWIAYADKLEKVIELVAGSSADELKRLHANKGLELVRPINGLVGNAREPS